MKIGLDAGTSFDLTEMDPHDNQPWDFTSEEKRNRAKQIIEKEKPFLLIGSPPCRSFNVLFQSNISRMNIEQVKCIMAEGIVHMNFCVELYRMQMDSGRFFLHEHPLSASSWKMPQVQ